MKPTVRTSHTWRTKEMNTIDYQQLYDNVKHMVNLLEYDSMRSPGKTKMNSQHLHSLYELKDRYKAMLKLKPSLNKEG